jgi:hypothetical protein
MNTLKTLYVLAFGSMLLAGCDANKNQPAAQTGPASPAIETPAPLPEDSIPPDEPDPAMSDTLPKGQEPPPPEPPPPPGG